MWTWGYNGTGQLGHGTRESTAGSRDLYLATPAPMIGGRQGGKHLAGIVAIAAGYENTYATDVQGRVWACGWNVYGGIGMGIGPIRAYNLARMQPVSELVDDEPEPIDRITGIAAGAYHAMAAGEGTGLLAWGHNGFGQLGDGTRQDREAAVPAVALGADFAPEPVPQPRGQAPPSPAVQPHFADPDPGEDDVLNVREHGAVGDGVHLDQHALQAAIHAVHEAGGGIVLVPKGLYRTGTLRLTSGVRLHLAENAILLGSTNRDHYEPRTLIAAEDAEGIAISGFKLGTETRGVFENIVCDNLHAYGGTTLGLYSVDGSAMCGVRVSNVYAEASRCAFAVRLGARLRQGYFGEDEPRVPGTLADIELRDLDIRMAARPWREVLLDHGMENAELAHQLWVRPVVTSFISGLPDDPVRNVRIEHVRIERPGDDDEDPMPAEVPGRPAAYPAAGMFGVLPAWGIYLRHAQDVTLRNIRLVLVSSDARPPLVHENRTDEDLVIDGLSVDEAWR